MEIGEKVMSEREALEWAIKEVQSKIKVAEQTLKVYEERLESSPNRDSQVMAEMKARFLRAQILNDTEKLLAFYKVIRVLEGATECELAILN
jgi:rubrerythrin